MQLDTPILTKLKETSGTSPKVKLTEPDSITIGLQQALKEDWIPIFLNSSKTVKNNITLLPKRGKSNPHKRQLQTHIYDE